MKTCKRCPNPATSVGGTYCKPCDARRARVSRERNPLLWILIRTKMNAKTRGIACTLTKTDLPKIPKYCPVLGIELSYAVGEGRKPESLSLDRIDNTKGYEPGNVIFMSLRANQLKRDASLEELIALGKFARKHLTKKPI